MGIAETFKLEMQADGIAFDDWTDEYIVAWLRDSLDLAGEGDPTVEAVPAEMKRRGLKLD